MFMDSKEPGIRVSNTHKTTFAFADPEPSQKYDFNTQGVRQRQFRDQPLQPGATRQSY